jgi:hypothetical protein
MATVMTNTIATGMMAIGGRIGMKVTVMGMKHANMVMVTGVATTEIATAIFTIGIGRTIRICLAGWPNEIVCLPGWSGS